ncbi:MULTISPECIES: hypothetical protein [unclassified Myroides]|uniref:hypothetical protein n=1 Tax=unclassified Myroides TaxID=2642485 RepID=UPI0015FBDC81|nr:MULTISPECIES: hypothetical protein [unclassified Myroides]MBB1150925.1 hypothetical protein [Myroides sp. NP-2]MDM1406815.1 hypothetical protein [Myroides sp. DF42-4-2]
MFKKVKYFLVCAGLALGVASCSSDDGSDPKLPLKSETYDITVEITESVGLDHIIVYKSNGTKVTTDVIFKDDGIPVAVTPGTPLPPRKLKWEKSYTKNSEEYISIIVKGNEGETYGEVNVTVKREEEIVMHKIGTGKDILVELGF